MRLPGGWNIALIIFLFFTLILLNYFNLVPLSKTFPFLSFLPHMRYSQVAKTTIIPSPTPLPPISVKKVDTVKGEGEFVINNPIPPATAPSVEEQVVVDGTYSVDNQDITARTSIRPLYGHPHPFPLFDRDSSDIYLTITINIDNQPIYKVPLVLTKETSQQSIPFSTIIPFYENSTINIYDESNKLLFSQEIKR